MRKEGPIEGKARSRTQIFPDPAAPIPVSSLSCSSLCSLFNVLSYLPKKSKRKRPGGGGGTISAQIQNHRALSTTDKVPAPLVYRTALRRAIGIAHGGASSHIPCEPYLHLTRHAHARTATGVGTCFAPPPWGEGGGGDARRGLHAATKVGIR